MGCIYFETLYLYVRLSLYPLFPSLSFSLSQTDRNRQILVCKCTFLVVALRRARLISAQKFRCELLDCLRCWFIAVMGCREPTLLFDELIPEEWCINAPQILWKTLLSFWIQTFFHFCWLFASPRELKSSVYPTIYS